MYSGCIASTWVRVWTSRTRGGTTERWGGVGVTAHDPNYPEREIWGLLLSPGEDQGFLSHMSYGCSYADPTDVTRRLQESGNEGFYFQSGGMGYEQIYVTTEDLVEAFRELGYEIPEVK